MMTINCLIIDDEPLAINVIKNYLQQIDNVNVINTFNSAIDALSYLKDHQVDLIFLDINMRRRGRGRCTARKRSRCER